MYDECAKSSDDGANSHGPDWHEGSSRGIARTGEEATEGCEGRASSNNECVVKVSRISLLLTA